MNQICKFTFTNKCKITTVNRNMMKEKGGERGGKERDREKNRRKRSRKVSPRKKKLS